MIEGHTKSSCDETFNSLKKERRGGGDKISMDSQVNENNNNDNNNKHGTEIRIRKQIIMISGVIYNI